MAVVNRPASHIEDMTHLKTGERVQDIDEWSEKARQAFDSSTSYVDNNWRKKWANDLRAFQSRHPSDSKYNSAAYQYRSKLYRPKTRSAVRHGEASGAAAFFSSLDALAVEAADEHDDLSVLAATVQREVLRRRLNQPEMKWFMTVIGGLQDALKVGMVASYNSWRHRVRWRKSGNTWESTVLEDRPDVKLWPLEWVRFHPSADWIDPFNTSPFLIRMIPMHVQDVRLRASSKNLDHYEMPFQNVTDGALANAKIDYDITQQARHQGNEQPQQLDTNIGHFDMVWVHEVVMLNEHNYDQVYYTLGSSHRISEVKPIDDVYWHGMRPMTSGFVVLETHSTAPPSLHALSGGLPKEINDLANVRMDNLHLATNKRYLVRRGTQVDLRSLTRAAPASITMVNDIERDVSPLEFRDINPGAFAEQDRLNVDYDELVGNFSQSSVQTNRSMNETVGGMNLAVSGANMINDYGLRCFSESWLEPTIRQVRALIAEYETDESMIKSAMTKVMEDVTPEEILMLLKMDSQVSIDVGVGASNPMFKFERFMLGVERYIKTCMEAGLPPRLDHQEFASEFFGYLGYKHPKFLQFPSNPEEAEALAQLEQQVMELQQALEQKHAEEAAKQQAETEREGMKIEGDLAREELKQRAETERHQAELAQKTESDAASERVTAAKGAIDGTLKRMEIREQRRTEALAQRREEDREARAAQREDAQRREDRGERRRELQAKQQESRSNRAAARSDARKRVLENRRETEGAREHERVMKGVAPPKEVSALRSDVNSVRETIEQDQQQRERIRRAIIEELGDRYPAVRDAVEQGRTQS